MKICEHGIPEYESCCMCMSKKILDEVKIEDEQANKGGM